MANIQAAYSEAFRRDSYQLLAWGFRDSSGQINSKCEETEITGLIVSAIDNLLDDPDTDARFIRYFVSEDQPFDGENRRGKERRRIDILIRSCDTKPRAKYIFEAKRLHHNQAPISNYLGKNGLQRFINEIYGVDVPEAAMVGYVQNQTIPQWENKLSKSLSTKSAKATGVIELLNKVEVIDELQHTWKSVHKRKSGNSIMLFHVFFDCCR